VRNIRDDVRCLRLDTGEILIGFFKNLWWKGKYELVDAQQCLVSLENNRMEVQLAPYIPFAKEYIFEVRHDKVQSVFQPKPQLEQNYKVETGNRVVSQRGNK